MEKYEVYQQDSLSHCISSVNPFALRRRALCAVSKRERPVTAHPEERAEHASRGVSGDGLTEHLHLIKQFPAVCLLGARQVGKTTLAKQYNTALTRE
ncbi:MAG: hypothetical protein A3F14_06665 [Gammaproteobacteria bacterium RIFCSPHIGHO2_12_FULL_43_28]|nr:MAG: hypothetical protein A3F14_06665 [Gammaproteobacteria bacterium RIFCSPHIGHO2_12_FULL_43_28]